MSKLIARFTPKFRDHGIVVNEHDYDRIHSVDVGGAIIHGETRVQIHDEFCNFEVWNIQDGERGELILSEPLSRFEAEAIAPAINGFDQ